MDNIISANGVYKKFNKVNALNGVDLNVRSGIIFSLLGPNGAGKTTFIRILTTLLKPDEGQIKVAGIDVTKDPASVRSIIGLTGQFAAIDGILTGRENLELIGRLYHLSKSEIRKKADYLLDYFGLEKVGKRQVKTYSGGMTRRLDLALSLMGNPQVLFLDEPTTGLDLQSRLAVWEIIRKLSKEGVTIFLTTQYLEEADNLANEIAVINKGAIIAQGSPKELKEKLGGNVLEIHLEDIESTEKVLNLLKSEQLGEIHSDKNRGIITIKTINGIHSLMQGAVILEKEKISISDIELRKPTLDEVFLELTGESTQEVASETKSVLNDKVVFEVK